MKKLIILGLVFLMLVLTIAPAKAVGEYKTYTPLLFSGPDYYGVETYNPGSVTAYQYHLKPASPRVIKLWLNWSDIESTKGIYNWPINTRNDLIMIKALGAIPWMVIKMTPTWARSDERMCSRILSEYIPNFAEFAKQAQLKYPDIKNWEVWNEEDADVGADGFFGCWGDPNDKYFGGGYYASVINPVKKAIQKVSPDSKVWFGGLMLTMDTPQMNYFEGAVRAGAKFDGVAFHAYSWRSSGFRSIEPQVNLIKSILTKYKRSLVPIALTETSYLYKGSCTPEFDKEQAEYFRFINQETARLKVSPWIWYAFDDPHWNCAGMFSNYRSKDLLLLELGNLSE